MKKAIIFSLIVTAVLVLIENVAGFAVAIPLFIGGDAAIGFSIGGNVVVYSAGPSPADADPGMGMEVIFNWIIFLIGFVIRTLIIYLIIAKKNKLSLFFSDHP